MLPEIVGSFDCEKCAAKAAEKVRAEGYDTADMAVVGNVTDMETEFRPEPDYVVSTKRGVLGGALVGFLIGVALDLYSGSAMVSALGAGNVVIPIVLAFGWSIFGMILGGSGLLAKRTLVAEAERRMEEELAHGRILLAVQIHRHKDFDGIAKVLFHAGAMDVRQYGSFLV